jgi:acyl-CoA reductase-like NAD-dependent aldehyde dehydrogenase
MHPTDLHSDSTTTDHTFAIHLLQRIYVHATLYDAFLPKFAALVQAYKLGDPADPSTTLGPVVSVASAEKIRKQVEDAVGRGAKKWVDERAFVAAKT